MYRNKITKYGLFITKDIFYNQLIFRVKKQLEGLENLRFNIDNHKDLLYDIFLNRYRDRISRFDNWAAHFDKMTEIFVDNYPSLSRQIWVAQDKEWADILTRKGYRIKSVAKSDNKSESDNSASVSSTPGDYSTNEMDEMIQSFNKNKSIVDTKGNTISDTEQYDLFNQLSKMVNIHIPRIFNNWIINFDKLFSNFDYQSDWAPCDIKNRYVFNFIYEFINENRDLLKGPRGEKGDKPSKEEIIEWTKQVHKGDKGEKGDRGDRGPQGPIGLTGPKGDRGEPGVEGPQGPLGNQGIQGIKGDKGERGVPGDTGPRGPQGEVGPRGPQGIKGDKGDKGEKGDEGPPGAFDDDTLTKWVENHPEVRGKDGIQGPQGPQGERGPQGIQGQRGSIGPKGDKGDVGPQGPKGVKGDTGPTGPRGPQGPVGPQGPKGVKGDTGPTGPRGPQGERGDQGPRGYTGSKGESVFEKRSSGSEWSKVDSIPLGMNNSRISELRDPYSSDDAATKGYVDNKIYYMQDKLPVIKNENLLLPDGDTKYTKIYTYYYEDYLFINHYRPKSFNSGIYVAYGNSFFAVKFLNAPTEWLKIKTRNGYYEVEGLIYPYKGKSITDKDYVDNRIKDMLIELGHNKEKIDECMNSVENKYQLKLSTLYSDYKK